TTTGIHITHHGAAHTPALRAWTQRSTAIRRWIRSTGAALSTPAARHNVIAAMTAFATPKACTSTPPSSRPGTSVLRVQQATPSAIRPTPSRNCSPWPQTSGRRWRWTRASLCSRSSSHSMACCRSSWRPSACQASLSSSGSMACSCRGRGGRGGVLADALLEAADPRGDVAFAQAEDLGDLTAAVLRPIEDEQGAVERRQRDDEALQHPHLPEHLVVAAAFVGQFVQAVLQRHRVPAVPALAPQVRDRGVER